MPSSTRVLNILQGASAAAAEGSTDKQRRAPFELTIEEEPPTPDQLRIILEYAGSDKSMELIDGAKDESDAIKKLKEDPARFKAPVVRSRSVTFDC